MRHPPIQMLRRTLRNRRKKKPSSDPWFRTNVSGILRKGTTQLIHPLGRAGLGRLQMEVSTAVEGSYVHGGGFQGSKHHTMGQN
jgi:hypothetical protein